MEAIREAIRIERLSKTFSNGRKALDEIDLRIESGEMVALIGASGSGKSTLLRHIASFTASDAQPSQIAILGRPIQQNGRIVREVRSIRRDIGFVFQQFNLVNRLSVESNVLIGALARLPWWRRLTGRFPGAERALSMAALNQVGIGEHARERAANLSGGQQQRAALARALVQRGGKVVYDGPSAALTPVLLKKLYGDDARELLDETAQRAEDMHAAHHTTASAPVQDDPARYAFALNPAHST